ncbi:MAG: thioredoxin-dependent thiol peroxidase [Bacteroidota bacterium]
MGKIDVGDKAPDFKAKDQDGKEIQLSDFRGKKVVLYFYPKDNTPGCTEEACNLRDNYNALLEKGYVVLGVSTDSEKSHQNFISKYSLPFSLISDPDRDVIKAYGAWGEKKMYGKSYEGVLRSTFVINEEGNIEKIIDKVNKKDHAAQILEE